MKNVRPRYFILSLLQWQIWLCLFVLFMSGHPILAQDNGQAIIDSLLAELPKVSEDSSKVLILSDISSRYAEFNTVEGLKYGNQALALAQNINWEKGIALSKGRIGRIYWQEGDYDTALKYHSESLAFWQQSGDKKKIASIHGYIGQDYADAGNYSEALNYLNLSLNGFKELGLKANEGAIYTMISWVYGNMGMNAEWIETQYAALRIMEETGDEVGYAVVSSNLAGSLRAYGKCQEAIEVDIKSLRVMQETNNYFNESMTYGDIGTCLAIMGNYAEALTNQQKALEIGRKINNHNLISNAYSRIGDIYTAQKDNGESLKYYLLAAESAQLADNKQSLANLYSEIGRCKVKLGQYKEARQYLDKAFILAKELNSISVMNNYYLVSLQMDSATGNWNAAFDHHKLFVETRDSMHSEETTKTIVQTRMQYDFDKKEAATQAEQEKKDALAKEELQRQKLIRNGFVGGFTVVMLFAGIFFSQRNKIKKGKKRSDELLLNILPAEVAEELKMKGSADARLMDEVSVMFSDFSDFTRISEIMSPTELVAEINTCFSAYDLIMQKHGVEKIKTVGDAYLAAGGVPVPDADHAIQVVRAAMEMQEFMRTYAQQREAEGRIYFKARLGVHSGPVVAGIVGIKKFAYDIWGDTVNTAQRMESACDAGRINISETTYVLIKDHFHCTYRGKISVKSKGEVDMYFVDYEINTAES